MADIERDPLPFVGRREELAFFKQCRSQALGGEPQTILLSGEAGIGKSRLVREYLDGSVGQGDVYAWARSDPSQRYRPYGPFVDILIALADLEGLSAAACRDRLRQVLRGLDLEVFDDLLARLVVPAENGNHLIALQDLQPHFIFESLTQFLRQIAKKQLHCLVLDDLQWADNATFAALDYLLENLADARLFLVLVYRTEEAYTSRDDAIHPLHAFRERWKSIASCALPRLSRNEVAALAQAGAPDRVAADPDFAAALYRQTEGLALFTTEWLKALGQTTHDSPPSLPPKAQAIIHYRLDRLAPEDRLILRFAAAMGENFEIDALAAALGEPRGRVLHRLERIGQVHQLLTVEHPTYRFAHGKIREALVAETAPHLRQAYALAIAEVMEQQGAPAHVVAHFARAGGDFARAARHTARAARRAVEQVAYEEARDLAHQALDLAGKADRAIEADPIFGDIGHVLWICSLAGLTVDLDLLRECYNRALDACDDPLGRADLHCWLYDISYFQQPDLAKAHLQQAREEIGTRTDTVQMARVYRCMASEDNIRARLALNEKALVLFEACAPEDPELLRLFRWMIHDLAYLGQAERVAEVIDRFRRFIDRRGEIVTTLSFCHDVSSAYRNLGQFREEAREREQALALIDRARMAHLGYQLYHHLELAQVYCFIGAIGRAEEHVRRVLDRSRDWGFAPSYIMVLMVAHAARIAGHPDLALELAEETCSLTEFPEIGPEVDVLDGYCAYLSYVERIYTEAGEPERFQTYCDRLRAKEVERGGRSERPWRPSLSPPAGDWTSWGAGLEGPWRWEDPHGVCAYEMGDSLTIQVPEVLGFNALTMPRLVQPFAGDFAIETTIAGAAEAEADQRRRLRDIRSGTLDRDVPLAGAGGIVVIDDQGRAVRLVAHIQCCGDVLFSIRKDHLRTQFGRGYVHTGEVALRLERRGDQFAAYCRGPDQPWQQCGECRISLDYEVSVGVCAEIPFPMYAMVRNAVARFSSLTLYHPPLANDAQAELERAMLKELALLAARETPDRIESDLVEAFVRVTDAGYGQMCERPAGTNWRALADCGVAPDGLPALPSEIEQARRIDPSGRWIFVPLGAVWGVDYGLLLHRERPFPTPETDLLEDAGKVARTILVQDKAVQQADAAEVEPVAHKARRPLPGVIGQSAAMQALATQVERTAQSSAPVLLQGESGTGKDVIARAIHARSPRSAKPFVVQNCAAIPDNLLESELFGYARGAFTGAATDKPGLFEAANGGTIFLDEIADASPAVQAKLLRAVEDGEIRRVGDTRTRKVDVRILSATSKDLADQVARGHMREDLFYRLNVMRLHLPPLRERGEDIPVLATHFLKQICDRDDRDISGFTKGAVELLRLYPWPGNVRELQNEVERCAALAADGPIGVDLLSASISGTDEAAEQDSGSLQQLVAHVERTVIRETLDRCGGNISAAARALGLSRPGLRQKAKRYGL